MKILTEIFHQIRFHENPTYKPSHKNLIFKKIQFWPSILYENAPDKANSNQVLQDLF